MVHALPVSLYPTFLGRVSHAPILKTLKLIDVSDDDSGSFNLPHTPLLKQMGIQVSIPFSSISINWGSLITVEANTILVGEYFDILELSAELESFRLHGLIRHPEYPLPPTPITHPALKELYLNTNESQMDRSELATMLDLVTFPSLEQFGYDSGSRTSFPNTAIPSIFN